MSIGSFTLQEHIALAALTTIGVGGPARWLVEARDEAAVRDALGWARERGVPFVVLGGGSNVVVADEGVEALVVRLALRGVTVREDGDAVEVTAAAGEPWDELVRTSVVRGWAGLECLSGIPGLVGATPIQNVGAYGQDVSETIAAVRALDTTSGEIVTLGRADCGFAYRDSRFKSAEPGRYVVLAVTYRLVPGGAPAVRYADVQRYLAERGGRAPGDGDARTPADRDVRDLSGRGARAPSAGDAREPTLGAVREAVLDIRRSKSMVLEATDPNGRSCGSFFVNPIVGAAQVTDVEARAGDASMPRWPEPDGRVKLSGAWLIERAGFRRGHREGPVGLSSRHALAVVAHEGARARDVVDFARRLQETVERRFGVRLTPEPVYWGFAPPELGRTRSRV